MLLKFAVCIYAILSYVFIKLSKDEEDDSKFTVSLAAIAASIIHLVLPI